MKKTLSMIAVSVVFVFLFLCISTTLVQAQMYTTVPAVGNVQPLTGSGAQTQQTTSGSNSQQNTSVTIKNPLNVNSIQEFIAEALKFVVNLLAIAGVLYIVWTGFLFVKAQGNPSELEKAKKSFFNAVIGMAIILGAWAIATVIANTINGITNNNDVTLNLKP